MKETILKNQIYNGARNRKALYDLTIPAKWNSNLIIFIHGYMGFKDWGCWSLVEKYFTEHNYAFLKYNVSHNGTTTDNTLEFTDLNAFSTNTYTKELEDLEEILHLVTTKFNKIPDIFLIGHSRGGGIALLSSSHPLVRKVSSWAGISNIHSRFPNGAELDEWKAKGTRFQKNSRTNQEMPLHYSQYEDFLLNEEKLNIQKFCDSATIPLQIIHGDSDTSVSIDEGIELAQWSESELQVIKGANHTFGSEHPWKSDNLPKPLEEVCRLTLSFFEKADSRDEKYSLLADLIKLANSDKEIVDQEFGFLLAIANQLGIGEDEFKGLFNRFITFTPPMYEFDRILQLQRLILLMNVDQEIDEKQIEMIKDLGMHMGLSPLAVEDVLKAMHEYENKLIPPERLIGIFKTYYN